MTFIKKTLKSIALLLTLAVTAAGIMGCAAALNGQGDSVVMTVECSSVSLGKAIVYITWEVDEDGYGATLYRDEVSLGTGVITSSYKGSYAYYYTDNNATPGATCTYKLVKGGKVLYSKTVTVPGGESLAGYSIVAAAGKASITIDWKIPANTIAYLFKNGERLSILNGSTSGRYTDTDVVPGTTYTYYVGNEYGNTQYTKTVSATVKEADRLKSDEFFWGTWINMASGEEYVIDLYSLLYNNRTYYFASSTTSSLEVSGLGTFVRDTEKVIKMGSIPYYRKGGVNLSYNMTIVGFENVVANARAAAGSSGKAGIPVQGKSDKYQKVEETRSDVNGNVTLHAPTAGDVQTITIQKDDSSVITVSDIQVNNNGDNMGTIVLADENSYSLKLTGKIPDAEKFEGTYLFPGTTYNMTVTIENISNVTSGASWASFECKDPRVKITSSEFYKDDLTGETGYTISTLNPGAKRTIAVQVRCAAITEDYLETGISVNVLNTRTRQVWVDYIPLRFYRGLFPVAIAAQGVGASASSAKLKGFVIYPDGNSSFFTVGSDVAETIFVPTFGDDKNALLVFSGATTSQTDLGVSEMYYAVAPYSEIAPQVKQGPSYMVWGAERENLAEIKRDTFYGYADAGGIFYWKIPAASNGVVVSPEQIEDDIGAYSIFADTKIVDSQVEVKLTWSVSGKAGYLQVYRDSDYLGTISAVSAEYVDTTGNPGSSYKYTFKTRKGEIKGSRNVTLPAFGTTSVTANVTMDPNYTSYYKSVSFTIETPLAYGHKIYRCFSSSGSGLSASDVKSNSNYTSSSTYYGAQYAKTGATLNWTDTDSNLNNKTKNSYLHYVIVPYDQNGQEGDSKHIYCYGTYVYNSSY